MEVFLGKDKLPKLTQEQSTCLDQLGCQASCSTRQKALEIALSPWIFIRVGCQQQGGALYRTWQCMAAFQSWRKVNHHTGSGFTDLCLPMHLPSSQDGESEAAFQGTFRPALSVTHLAGNP